LKEGEALVCESFFDILMENPKKEKSLNFGLLFGVSILLCAVFSSSELPKSAKFF